MSFADDLRRALLTYRAAVMSANGPAIDTSRDTIARSKPGSAHLMFVVGELPLDVEMERSFARWCDVWERRLSSAQATAPNGDTKSAARKAQTKALLDSVGIDPTALAFIYGQTTESVRKLRQRHGLDPDTGERARSKTLTAKARDQLAAYESATTTPEED